MISLTVLRTAGLLAIVAFCSLMLLIATDSLGYRITNGRTVG
jgi:hypothetical protein